MNQRPPNDLRCKQDCAKYKAQCVDTDRCACLTGSPIYDGNNNLKQCVEGNSTLNQGALSTEDGKVFFKTYVFLNNVFFLSLGIACMNEVLFDFVNCMLSLGCWVPSKDGMTDQSNTPTWEKEGI